MVMPRIEQPSAIATGSAGTSPSSAATSAPTPALPPPAQGKLSQKILYVTDFDFYIVKHTQEHEYIFIKLFYELKVQAVRRPFQQQHRKHRAA